VEARAALARREVSSVELTQAALDRAHALQADYNAFIRFDDESALLQAKAMDARLAAGCSGALTGIPLAFKDMFYRQGQVSTCGSKLRQDWKAPVTAQVLDSLDNAGAVSLGTLNMTEFAYGPTGQNAWTGDARNPWNRDCISGGSSSGSAIAVATRMAFGTLGSDTAGSVRMPAALCGVTGMKTTYGLVSRFGCMPLSGSLDTPVAMCATRQPWPSNRSRQATIWPAQQHPSRKSLWLGCASACHRAISTATSITQFRPSSPKRQQS
jgi:aspartyl-tRNA(Asn)/glutamyl-tRNA(Gln) amidotransferase subunit A